VNRTRKLLTVLKNRETFQLSGILFQATLKPGVEQSGFLLKLQQNTTQQPIQFPAGINVLTIFRGTEQNVPVKQRSSHALTNLRQVQSGTLFQVILRYGTAPTGFRRTPQLNTTQQQAQLHADTFATRIIHGTVQFVPPTQEIIRNVPVFRQMPTGIPQRKFHKPGTERLGLLQQRVFTTLSKAQLNAASDVTLIIPGTD